MSRYEKKRTSFSAIDKARLWAQFQRRVIVADGAAAQPWPIIERL